MYNVSISDAIRKIGIQDWTLSGEPSNEEEFLKSFKKIIGTGPEGSILSSDPKDFGVNWSQIKLVYDQLSFEYPKQLLRKERDRRLAETDWWASSDLQINEEQKTYRQQLRDITNNYSSLETVVWPIKPE